MRRSVCNARQVYDSDGRRYRQLVKSGQDDMRQDAVMQQFFQLANVLLAADPATRKRQLHIVTYKVEPCRVVKAIVADDGSRCRRCLPASVWAVLRRNTLSQSTSEPSACERAFSARLAALTGQVVPFSPASGLLEWCEDTQPLGEYLLGGGRRSGGAHGRYHQPGQLTHPDALAQYNRDLSAKEPSEPAKRCVPAPCPCRRCCPHGACRCQSCRSHPFWRLHV